MKNQTPLVTVPSRSLGMKALPKILLALTAVAALSVAYPAKANLITNPGFETGDLTGWTHAGFAIALGTDNNIAPHSGNFQAVLNGAAVAQSVTTTPGSTYIIDFFAAASNGLTDPVNFTLTVNFGGTVFSHLFTARTLYTEFTFNATAPASSTSLNFSVTGLGFLHLDDVSVEPAGVGVPDAGSTLPLLGFASLGLVALRRKLRC